MRERFDRAWPSLVALVGTVGVVLLLLFLFGDNTSDDSGDDTVAGSDDGAGGDSGADDEADDGTDGGNPDPTDEPTDPTDSPDEESGEESGDETGDASGDETGDEDGEGGEDGEDGEDPDAEPTTAPPELRSPVGIANQTAVAGLETQAQDELEAGGWEVAATSGFNGSVPETTVYYPPGLEESAEALARQFPEIGRVQPSFEGINQTRLVVVLVDDYVDTDDG